MKKSMLEEEVPVYSDKYNVHGTIKDYGMVTKLFFTYNEKDIVMDIDRNPLKEETFEEIGRKLINSYIDHLYVPGRKLQLHEWYIKEYEVDGETYRGGTGIVTGHPKIADSTKMYTSEVRAIIVDDEAGELILTTRNNIYHCPLSYCRFRKQDKYPDVIPDYEKIKEKYKDTIVYPSIEPGKILLVLYTGWLHTGTFQDSYLIEAESANIDLRYFPHFQNIEFYAEFVGDRPWYIENIGETVIYADTSSGIIKLEPGTRKKVCRENAEKESPALPKINDHNYKIQK